MAEGSGCKAIRVREPDDLEAAFEKAHALMVEFRVPVVIEVIEVIEVILEPVTNMSMGTSIGAISEFEELATVGTPEDAKVAHHDLAGAVQDDISG